MDKDVEVTVSLLACCSRLQPDCNSSDPLPYIANHGQVGGPGPGAAVFSRLVSFCRTVKGKAVSGWGSGRRRQHNSICPRCCQLWRKGSGQGLIISLGRAACDCVALTQSGNSAHIGHPARTHSWPRTPSLNPSMYMHEKWIVAIEVVKSRRP